MGVKWSRDKRRHKVPAWLGTCWRCRRAIFAGQAHRMVYVFGRDRHVHEACAQQIGPPTPAAVAS